MNTEAHVKICNAAISVSGDHSSFLAGFYFIWSLTGACKEVKSLDDI